MNKKVTELTETSEITDKDVLMIVQNGENKQIITKDFKKILPIVDNLESTSTEDALSANQGRILIERINEKNIITARLTSGYTIQQTDVAEAIKSFVDYNKLGEKLKVENGVIKIGTDVSKVKVSYNAMVKKASSGDVKRTYIYLRHNTTSLSQENVYFYDTYAQASISLPPILIDVKEGDEFYLQCYGQAGSEIAGASTFLYTAITVEVVE